MFFANYGDGLSDLPLPAMLDTFTESNAIASVLLVQPTGSFDIVYAGSEGIVRRNLSFDPYRYVDQWRLLRDAQGDLPLYSSRARSWSGNRFSDLIR